MTTRTIDLVSNHAIDLADLTGLLEDNHFEVRRPRSVAAAMLQIKDAPSTAILVDGIRSEDDPISIVRNFRKLRPDVPAVLLHDPARPGIAGPAVRAGVRGFLQRPFSAKQVVSEIEQAVETTALEVRHIHEATQSATRSLASGTTHYVNNLLEGVIGRSSMLATHSDLPGAVYRDLRAILDDGKRIATLMKRLSYLAELETSADEDVHLLRCLQAAVRTVGSRRNQAIRMECLIDQDPVLKGSSAQATDLLIELLENACDAGEAKAPILVRVSLDPAGHQDHLEIRIIDQGRGIRGNEYDRIFEPFFSGTTEGGRGLGLPIARTFATQLGGTLRIRPGSPGGAEAIVRFPVENMTASAAPLVTEMATPDATRQVLVIDDMPGVLEMISRMVAKATSQPVVSITNGPEAVAFAAEPENDLSMVLLDLGLQGTKGTIVYEQIREHRPAVPILFISGFSSVPDLAGILGQDHRARFLQKPFDLSQLREAIRSWQAA